MEKIKKQQKIIENLKKCSHFATCGQNICPLDPELKFRCGKKQDRCRYMREPKQSRIGQREFISGGSVMSDALLNIMPQENIKYINKASRERLAKIKK